MVELLASVLRLLITYSASNEKRREIMRHNACFFDQLLAQQAEELSARVTHT